MKKLLAECKFRYLIFVLGEPNWTALRKAVEDEEESIVTGWGERKVDILPITGRAPDVIRKHE